MGEQGRRHPGCSDLHQCLREVDHVMANSAVVQAIVCAMKGALDAGTAECTAQKPCHAGQHCPLTLHGDTQSDCSTHIDRPT